MAIMDSKDEQVSQRLPAKKAAMRLLLLKISYGRGPTCLAQIEGIFDIQYMGLGKVEL